MRSVTTFDEEWTDDDINWALDWKRDHDLRCGGCGHRLDETTNPERWNDWDADIVVCNACAQGDRAQAAEVENASDNKLPPGARPRIWERTAPDPSP